MTNKEYVVTRALGNEALRIHENHLLGASLLTFDFGQDIIEIVEGFNPWVQRGRRLAPRGPRHDF